MAAAKKGSLAGIIGTLLVIGAIGGAIYVWKAGGKTIIPHLKPKHEFQKGMCYVTWTKDKYASPESDESMRAMARTGAKWVAIVTTWYQDSCYTSRIYPTEKTPSDESIIHAIDMAHSLGMKVMLKPHLDVVDASGGGWRGEISCASEPEWKEWFKNYRDFILHYAKIAEAKKVELYCIGTELTSVATIKENMWKEMVIAPTRRSYGGPLTYAANWNEEYRHVKFWDALDYVGIDPYFPLSDKNRPTLAEIKEGWVKWANDIEDFQKTVNMPIIFPEAGYCSAEGAAITPWEETNGLLDLQQQVDCYQALLETFWSKDWFYGVYWWKWGTSVKFGGPRNRGYSLQNKPSQDLVTKWYALPVPPKKSF